MPIARFSSGDHGPVHRHQRIFGIYDTGLFQGVAGSSAAEPRLRLEAAGLGEPSIAMPITATRSYPTPPLRHPHRSSVQSKTSTSSPPSKPSPTQLVYKLDTCRAGPRPNCPATARPREFQRRLCQRRRRIRDVGRRRNDHGRSRAPLTLPSVWPSALGGKGWLGRAGGGYDHRFSAAHRRRRIRRLRHFEPEGHHPGCRLQDWQGKTKQTWAWAAGARAGWLIASGHPELTSTPDTPRRTSPVRNDELHADGGTIFRTEHAVRSRRAAGFSAAAWKPALGSGLVLAQRIPLRRITATRA